MVTMELNSSTSSYLILSISADSWLKKWWPKKLDCRNPKSIETLLEPKFHHLLCLLVDLCLGLKVSTRSAFTRMPVKPNSIHFTSPTSSINKGESTTLRIGHVCNWIWNSGGTHFVQIGIIKHMHLFRASPEEYSLQSHAASSWIWKIFF